MPGTHLMNSFRVQLGGLELGHATFSLPPSGSEARGLFKPGLRLSRLVELIDRVLVTEHSKPASPAGLVIVDPSTGTRVGTVLTLYGPVAGGRGTWQIVVRFDTAPGQ